MAKPRPLDGGDSFWLEENPLTSLQNFDPLRETTAQSRAIRKGETFIPFEQRQQPSADPPAPLAPTPAQAAPLASSASGAPMDLLSRANADPDLSYMGLKILLAVLAFPPGEPISLSRFSELTRLSKTGVISGIRNSLDAGYITRAQSCPRCGMALSYTEDKKTVPCAACKRDVPPQARYAVFDEDRAVVSKDSPVPRKHNPPVFANDSTVPLDNRVVAVENSPVVGKDSPPVFSSDRGAVLNNDSPDAGKDRLNRRAAALASRMGTAPVVGKDSPPVTDKDSPRARADSESVTRIKNSDSRIPPKSGNEETGRVVYGSQEWQQITERLAKDSARRIGDKSIGFHVKVWAHARKIGWEKGGRLCEDGLLLIAQELEGKYNATGRSQGALWTKMVRRYFEEKGHALLTEAEQEEWKELHGTYQPPAV